jgi:hypothetical protein
MTKEYLSMDQLVGSFCFGEPGIKRIETNCEPANRLE